MKLVFCLVILAGSACLFSCKSDDSVTCTTCSAPQTLDFQLCEESDGNASVNGENTGTPYNIYLQDLQADGVTCGN
ncbi:hypothetical protein J1N09_08655 [Aureitalea sp. L0-47]|uniref:hypothetical protein n=1 Tax=Aureitalea sp. L0-47 TaxID=2816962 RepID=UPI002237CF37|nr:hypothetical protein [Aureitalea sp. L0-47]MCW5519905.1 hypothetical protein [Aureitalea sp. L0-47]